MASDITLPLTGGCNCGAVRFEIREAPEGASTATAPAASGAPGRPRRPRRACGRVGPRSCRARSTSGAWRPGDGLDKEFCGACGSALFASDPKSGEPRAVRLGAIDGDPGVRPSARQFTAYAAPWEPIPDDGLPRHPEGIRR